MMLTLVPPFSLSLTHLDAMCFAGKERKKSVQHHDRIVDPMYIMSGVPCYILI